MLIKTFFAMLSLTSYMEYAIAQKKDLSVVNGVIIYSTEQQEIPMVIVFIPAILKPGESFDSFLNRSFLDRSNQAYIVYFQGIRWILRDLADTINSLKFVPLSYGINDKPMKASYGKLTFDKTFPGDPDNVQKLEETKVNVTFRKRIFTLNVSEWPDTMGTAKLFEKLEF
jgi:hypothetical protein